MLYSDGVEHQATASTAFDGPYFVDTVTRQRYLKLERDALSLGTRAGGFRMEGVLPPVIMLGANFGQPTIVI